MKCKKHLTDVSSSVGVCASCLRERLIVVIAAQVENQRQSQLRQAQQDCRKSDAQQEILRPLPRSVSPYISHRKSDSAATWHFHGNRHRFYSTPQVGPSDKSKKSGVARFSSIFSGLFRSKTGTDPGPGPGFAHQSWVLNVITGRRKKQIRTFSVDEDGSEPRQKAGRFRGRGMSPAKSSDGEDEEHTRGGLSGYSSGSSQNWKRTPRTPTVRRGKGRTAEQSRSVSGLAFCLSPLVHPGPNRNRSQKVAPPEIMTAAGDGGVPPHLSAAVSFGKNRSRKLADFGKQSHNCYPNH